jgi:predicted permease
MSSVFASLIPVFLVIAAGWAARTTGFVSEQHWAGLERATYVIFFPALIIDTLARADLGSVPVLGVGGAMTATILLLSAFLLAARVPLQRWLGLDGPGFTSLFQGATRWNTFVAIAVTGSLFGQRGIALMAVAIAAMVPLLNVLAIYVFLRFAGGPRQSPKQILITFAANPFIWSSAVGLLLNPVFAYVPQGAATFVEITGRAGLAAGLLVVGAGLDIRSLARPGRAHSAAILLKLVAAPILVASLARLFGVSGLDVSIAVVAASVPTASGAYVLARQLGGNAPLMAEILTLQTLLALVTMPVMMALLGG